MDSINDVSPVKEKEELTSASLRVTPHSDGYSLPTRFQRWNEYGNVEADYIEPAYAGSDIFTRSPEPQPKKPKPLVAQNYQYRAENFSTLIGSFTWYRAFLRSLTTGSIDNLGDARGFGEGVDTLESQANYVYNEAVERLGEKVRGGLDLSVSTFEWQQTKRMITSAHKASNYMGNLIDAYNAVLAGRKVVVRKGLSVLDGQLFDVVKRRRGERVVVREPRPYDKKKELLLKSVVKDVGGNFLQWKYGLSPLISDIHAAATELIERRIPKLQVFEAKKTSILGPLTVSNAVLENNYGFSPLKNVTRKGKVGARFRVKLKARDGFDLARLTSLNPASIAYELLPYSFVLDYIIDIGQWLRSVETAMLYDNVFESGYLTQLRAARWTAHYDQVVLRGPEEYYQVKGDVSYDGKLFQRTVLGSFPLPRSPQIKINIGASRMFSIAALLSTKLNRGTRGYF